jgi:hypothetical protein
MEIIRFVVFIVIGLSIYCYMGNMLAMTNEKLPAIAMLDEDSHKIWNLVEDLEDSWYVKDPFSLKIAPLDLKKAATLKALVKPYKDLDLFVTELIIARRSGDQEAFQEQKKNIMHELAPIWARSIKSARAKNESMSLLEWIKNNIRNAMNNAYGYLFTNKQNM